MTLRPSVQRFAELMEEKLCANERKGNWQKCTTTYLSRRCGNELQELRAALKAGRSWVRKNTFKSGNGPVIADNYSVCKEIGSEAADVANFAMMIADVCGALTTNGQ